MKQRLCFNSFFRRYEGRCGLPSNFDSNYCYALGYAAGALLHSGKTGLISSVCARLYYQLLRNYSPKSVVVSMPNCVCMIQVGNLGEPVENWTVGGTALTSLMDVERRHGKMLKV